jgi:hypothetical protein
MSTITAAPAMHRRGHGRSSQPWNGNEMDTGLAALVEALDLKTAIHVHAGVLADRSQFFKNLTTPRRGRNWGGRTVRPPRKITSVSDQASSVRSAS